jgi:Flp pilus assembly protein TadG
MRALGRSLGTRSRGSQSGQSLVELAIILPLALFLLTSAIDVGRIIFTYIAIEDAAHEGAVFMAHNPANPTTNATGAAAVRNRVWTSTTASEVTGAAVNLTCSATSPAPPGRVSVEVVAPALNMLTPGGNQIFGSLVLRSTITAPNLKEACP